MIRVLLVDDHNIFREGLKQILAETPDIRVTGEAACGRDAVSVVQEGDWDVVIMDISMPEGSGLETLAQFRALREDLPVLFLSMYPEDQYAIRLLKAGAAGYLSKDAAPDGLIEAIRKVARGGRYVTPSTAERLAAHVGSDVQGPLHEALSDREFQVLRLIASGKSVGDIAKDLSLSVKTISTYRARVLGKMHMKSNAELTRYALDHDLVL